MIPNALSGVPDLYAGGSATANLLFALPQDAIGTGVWGISDGWADPVFLAAHGMKSVPIAGSDTAPGTAAGAGAATDVSNGDDANTPAESANDFDADWATTQTENLVSDIATADERFDDSPEIGASRTMDFLAGDIERLLDAGIPPGVDESAYYARVTTLQDFFARARDSLDAGKVSQAAAEYQTARANVPPLLAILNKVLGTNHSVPTWEYRP